MAVLYIKNRAVLFCAAKNIFHPCKQNKNVKRLCYIIICTKSKTNQLVRNRQLILLNDSAPLPYEPDILTAPRFVSRGQALLEEIGVF